MNKGSFILVFLSILLFNTSAYSQQLTAQASKTVVMVGEQFQVSFTLNSSGSNFEAPSFQGFNVYSGPNQSTSMSIANGKRTQSVSLSYVIAAKKEGKFTINAAKVLSSGKTLESKPFTITVSKNAAKINSGKELFVRSTVSKKSVFQGERITIVHKVYSRSQLVGFQDIELPDYAGFWTHDVKNKQDVQVSNEVVNGQSYQVAKIITTHLFPQQTGKIKISPAKLECVVRKKSTQRARSAFEQLFGGGYKDVTMTAIGNAVDVNIKPLPTNGKPTNYSGAVGQFTFGASLSQTDVKANDGVNLVLKIKGKGNIKLIEPIDVPFPADFEKYDAKVTEKISIGEGGVSGRKSFDYLVIPRHEGTFEMEKIEFNYFDPRKQKYVRLYSKPFILNVAKGEGGSSVSETYTNSRKEDVKIIGNDIRYIQTGAIFFSEKDSYFFGSTMFYLSLIIPFSLFLAFIFLYKKYVNDFDPLEDRQRKANKLAKKHLESAEKNISSGNKEEFYEILSKAMYGYLSDRFAIEASELNKDHIKTTLKAKKVQEETLSKLISILNECEYARYAPGSLSDDLNTQYITAVELITKIEDETV